MDDSFYLGRIMINLNRLKKEEIIWLNNHRCRHRHRYLEHLPCYEQEAPRSPIVEKVGYLDIETTGLNADYDYIISYYIYDGKNFYGRTLTQREVLNWQLLDKKLMYEFCEDIRRFDRVVVYWGKDRRHDIPFLRSRAIKAKADFPLYKEILITDLYDICKNKLRLSYYRMENVCKFLGIPAKQHPLNPEIWQKAKLGDKSSLDYVGIHNKEDTVSPYHIDLIMNKYSKNPKVSI